MMLTDLIPIYGFVDTLRRSVNNNEELLKKLVEDEIRRRDYYLK